MLSEQSTVTFLWRCSDCPAVYDAESVALLLHDGSSRACSCGGRLVEDVGPAPGRGPQPDRTPRRAVRYTLAGVLRAV